jgi:predicted nucleic acid-binding protein
VSGWLLDTDVLSGFAPTKRPLPSTACGWFDDRSDALFISSITVVEIEAGVAKLRRTGGIPRADSLSVWFDRILSLYGERVLPFDSMAARLAGQLGDAAFARGRHPGFADVAIGAIAVSRNLIVATLNVRHFEAIHVPVINPFRESGEGGSSMDGEEHG